MYVMTIAMMALAPLALPAPVGGVGGPQSQDWMEDALEVVRERDPSAFQELLEALEDGGAEVRHELVGHALYLLELESMAAEHPRLHEAMVHQEEIEGRVWDLVQTLEEGELGETERRLLHEQLRSLLDEWFDLRQTMRWYETDELGAQHAAQLEEWSRTMGEPGDAREGWLERLASADPDVVEAVQRDVEFLDPFHVLAPQLMEHLVERFPEREPELRWCAARSEERLIDRLRAFGEENPQLLAEVSEALGDVVDRQERLRSAILAAREAILPRVRPDGSIALSGRERHEIDRLLEVVVEAELELTRSHLDRVEEELAESRALLRERELRRETIVELQHARLTGSAALFEW